MKEEKAIYSFGEWMIILGRINDLRGMEIYLDVLQTELKNYCMITRLNLLRCFERKKMNIERKRGNKY